MADFIMAQHIGEYTLCPALVSLKIHTPEMPIWDAPERKEYRGLCQQESQCHEERIIQKLLKDIPLKMVDPNLSWEKQDEATRRYMEEGVVGVCRPVLVHTGHGVKSMPAAILKEYGRSDYLGSYYYYPLIAEHTRFVNDITILMKLTFHAYALLLIQKFFPPFGKIIDSEGAEHKIFLEEYKRVMEKKLNAVRNLIKGKKEKPKPCPHCPQCCNKYFCLDYFKHQDNVCIVPTIDLKYLQPLEACGIKTVEDLHLAPDDTINRLVGVYGPSWRTWKAWAEAYKTNRLVVANEFKAPPDGDEFIISIYGDIQSDRRLLVGILIEKETLAISRWKRKFFYLFQDKRFYRERWVDKNSLIMQFFIRGDDDQALIRNFLEIISHSHLPVVYFYGDYTDDLLYKVSEWEKIPTKLRLFLRNTKLINLREVLKQSIGIPTDTYNIRDVCFYLSQLNLHLGSFHNKHHLSLYSQHADTKLHLKESVLLACRRWMLTKDPRYRDKLFALNQDELEAEAYVLSAVKTHAKRQE